MPRHLVLVAPPRPSTQPQQETLSDWRVGLVLLGRFDGVKAAVDAAAASGSVQGKIARERFEYANHVFRHELQTLAPVMGFTLDDVDESLWKANNVSKGILAPGPADRSL